MEKDKKRITIEHLLKAYHDGLSIQDTINKTGLARHTILTRLHRLEGEQKVRMRQVNMAKLYYWQEELLPEAEAWDEAIKELHKGTKLTELKEEHIQHDPSKKREGREELDLKAVKAEIEERLKSGEIKKHEAQILEQRAPVKHLKKKIEEKEDKEFITSNFKEIKWMPEMSVGEETIDKQHQQLLAQIQKLTESVSNRSEFSESALTEARQVYNVLHNYIKEHLAYEEEYLKKIKYPEFDRHKKIHDGFIKFFHDFKKKFNSGLYTEPKAGEESISEKLNKLTEECRKFLGLWWVNHILKEDHKYADFAESKGLIAKKEKIEEGEPTEKGAFDIASIKSQIEAELTGKKKTKEEKEKVEKKGEYIYTGIEGFDALLEKGIPKGAPVLVAGGAGSGKTIFVLQTLKHHASQGKKCLYMSFEESDEKLIRHMEDFGWNAKEYIKKGNLLVKRFNPFEITRSVDALLMKAKGELLIDVKPIIFPGNFKPDFIAVDSLTAIASAFTGKEDSYRIYIEQLFRFFEEIGATSFLITETKQVPTIFSTTGVEEFLADGVVVLYNIKRGNIRERAIEVLKLRGAGHQKKIVAMNITSEGIEVFPEQEVFGGVGEE